MNKNHTITINGRCFYTAQVVDVYDKKTYDQTIIFEEPADRRLPPSVVNYYYGEPEEHLTKDYVNNIIAYDNAPLHIICHLLMDAERRKIAPNIVADMVYEDMLKAGYNTKDAEEYSDAAFTLAGLIDPPTL